MTGKRKAWLIGAVVVVSCVLVAGAILFSPRRFDSLAWKAHAGNYSGENPRGSMVSALERLVTRGTSKAEVEELLGRPDRMDGETYVYYLGRDFAGPSFCVYEIAFDRDARVSKGNWRRH